MYVMLRQHWQGNWKRCVRDENGNVLRTLIFGPGVPVEPSREDLEALKADIGGPLVPIEFDRRNGKIRVLEPDEVTAAMEKVFGRKQPDDPKGPQSQQTDQDPPETKGDKPEKKPQTARS